MAFSLKTWVNRISEYPNRRKLTHEDGSTELVTVARAEGHISAEGNAFSAEEMNDLENRIKGGFDEVNQSLRELNEGMIYNDVRTGVVTVLPNSDISISDNTPINFKDYVPLATTIIATYGSSDAHSHGMLGSPAIKDNTTCCVRYKNLTESELKVDFTVRFYYLRNN
jgi:hypothetical protein|nr:MAG TPA: hypothetical protein [Caudoviricetes sp.]